MIAQLSWTKIKTGLRRKVRELLFEIDTRSVELFIAVEGFVLGTFLMLPIDTFGSSAVYRAMAGLMPEYGWGFMLAVVGALQLAHALQPDPEDSRRRKWLAAITAAMYAFITCSFLIANPATTAGVVYGLFALSQVWVFINLDSRRT